MKKISHILSAVDFSAPAVNALHRAGLIASTDDPTFTGALVEHGYPAGEVTTFQRENGCDLVVIGKHGAGYFSDLLVGSVTKLVITNTSCDTLVTFDRLSSRSSI